MTPPPVGSPNYYLGSQDNNAGYGAPLDALNLWKFHADFNNPPNSTFTLTNTLPTSPFNSILALCGGSRACIPQPNTSNRIDHLGYRQRPTFRLAYRNFGDHESLVTNQSVSAGTGPNGEVSGIRWWELRSPNSSPVIFQEGTYAPGLTDGIHRWMGSIAMNSLGDIALGFSASNSTNPSVFPSVFYTARHAGDPPGHTSAPAYRSPDGSPHEIMMRIGGIEDCRLDDWRLLMIGDLGICDLLSIAIGNNSHNQQIINRQQSSIYSLKSAIHNGC